MNLVHNSPQMDIILNTSVVTKLQSTPSTPTSALSKRVCRNLFGHPDPRSSYARDKVNEILKQQQQKWNFNFDLETPLDGRFQWEPVAVESSAEVPQAYACERLPFIASASSSTTPSSIPRNIGNIEPRNLYATPSTPTNKSHRDVREPLLIVRPVSSSLSKSVEVPSAGTSTATTVKQQESNDQSTSNIATNDDDDDDVIPPTQPVNSVNFTCIKSTPQDSSSESEETSKESKLVKIQVKSTTKQALIHDYMTVRKRKAPSLPQTAGTGKKKAAK